VCGERRGSGRGRVRSGASFGPGNWAKRAQLLHGGGRQLGESYGSDVLKSYLIGPVIDWRRRHGGTGCHRKRWSDVVDLGLPDLPYFTRAPVFQVISPVSRLKPIRETLSPVFRLLWILLHDLAVLQRKLTFTLDENNELTHGSSTSRV